MNTTDNNGKTMVVFRIARPHGSNDTFDMLVNLQDIVTFDDSKDRPLTREDAVDVVSQHVWETLVDELDIEILSINGKQPIEGVRP